MPSTFRFTHPPNFLHFFSLTYGPVVLIDFDFIIVLFSFFGGFLVWLPADRLLSAPSEKRRCSWNFSSVHLWMPQQCPQCSALYWIHKIHWINAPNALKTNRIHTGAWISCIHKTLFLWMPLEKHTIIVVQAMLVYNISVSNKLRISFRLVCAVALSNFLTIIVELQWNDVFDF